MPAIETSYCAAQAPHRHCFRDRKDKNGNLVSLATVSIKNTRIITTAGEDGHFILKQVPAGNHTIVISAVGFARVEKELQCMTTKHWK